MESADVRSERKRPSSPGEVTEFLRSWTDGDTAAGEQVMALLYADLKAIARRQLQNEGAGHTLQPTALVHEAYARLVGLNQIRWQDRSHFFGAAAQTMRRILVDHARKRSAAKRGDGQELLPLEEGRFKTLERPAEVLAVDEALTELAQLDPRKAKIVELRVFGGLEIEETADVMGCSRTTVVRQWRLARLWLRQMLVTEPSRDA